MGIATSQQLTRYYDQYRDREVIFNKDIIRSLKLDPRQVQIKYTIGSDVKLCPCIVNSTSFQKAKIILNTKTDAFEVLIGKEPPSVQLKFAFFQDNGQLVTFFVSTKVAEKQLLQGPGDLALVTLQYTQRPPDDLIEIVGRMLEANTNAVRRKEERIVINEDTKRKLGLVKEECVLVVQGVPRHCIIRDLSFSGAKVFLVGIPHFMTNKEAELKMNYTDPDEVVMVKGMIMSAEPIEGRKDICAASIKFDENQVPLSYKLHINNYLTTVRKAQLSASDQIAAQRAAAAQSQQQ
jgi:hypothetical protein